MSDRFRGFFKSGSKVVLLFVFPLLFGCEKEKFSESPIPYLELTGAQVFPHPVLPKDSIIVLDFAYTDGDGNIGFPDSDTLSSANFLVHFFEIKNGVETPYVIPLTDDTLNFNQRTPYLTPEGKHKSIKGKITIRIPANPYIGYFPDSVVFKSRLIDRDFNISNEVKTPILTITHQ